MWIYPIYKGYSNTEYKNKETYSQFEESA